VQLESSAEASEVSEHADCLVKDVGGWVKVTVGQVLKDPETYTHDFFCVSLLTSENEKVRTF
jgi:hypothetical protein